jgi:nitrate/nitrite transporter NarK
MNETRWQPVIGLAFGIALGFAGAFGGFAGFVIVLVLGVVGFLVGRMLTGELDLSELLGIRKRS